MREVTRSRGQTQKDSTQLIQVTGKIEGRATPDTPYTQHRHSRARPQTGKVPAPGANQPSSRADRQ